MRISVFGGSQTKEGSAHYAEAQELGASLALMGHTVLTGGYAGAMEAVSHGAASAGGQVIGVTCGEIERSHGVVVNRWVTEEWKTETLLERLQALIAECDAALALPGGPGTLTEIALTWNLMITGGIRPKPLILIGDAWRAVLGEFYLKLGAYTPTGQRNLLVLSPDAGSAVETLRTML
jgi:uncharacterized protein (TIGR00730 family)